MAAPPARARADYDYLIKLLLIGDSGKFCLFGFDFVPLTNKILEKKKIKLGLGMGERLDLYVELVRFG